MNILFWGAVPLTRFPIEVRGVPQGFLSFFGSVAAERQDPETGTPGDRKMPKRYATRMVFLCFSVISRFPPLPFLFGGAINIRLNDSIVTFPLGLRAQIH